MIKVCTCGTKLRKKIIVTLDVLVNTQVNADTLKKVKKEDITNISPAAVIYCPQCSDVYTEKDLCEK